MQKIPTLFERNRETDHLVRNAVVEGCAWVLAGEGHATEKFDGTACLVNAQGLWKRSERKLLKSARKRGAPYSISDFKPAPEGWIPAGLFTETLTGHWPGWLLVSSYEPADQWHVEAWLEGEHFRLPTPFMGTCELVGPKVQGNPYRLVTHQLWLHGSHVLDASSALGTPPRTFEGLRAYLLERKAIEGIVWYHEDGRRAKLKRRDFGFEWPAR